jgi:MFS family permease
MQPELPLGRWALFRNGEFSRLWGIGAVSSTIRWLELLAIGVVVFDLTGSPFQVALMAILRMLPLALFGALVGALAERLNHRKMLVTGLLVMIGVSGALAVLSKTGHIQLWHIAVGVFISGMFWVLDYSVRKTLLGAAVDGKSLGHAMSLDTVSNNGTRMLGPILGGMFLQWVGLTGVYVFAAVGYIGASLCALALGSTIGRSEQKDRGIISAIGRSFPLLKSQPLLAGILMVTVVFNLWGFPFISMIPVIGKEILALNSFYVGLLMSAEGCGALIGALLIAGTGQSRHYRKLYICGLGLYLMMAIVFSQSTSSVGSGACLLVVGLGVAAFAAMQSTLILLTAPEEARSLMMGLLTMCIGMAPIGFLHIGLLADWLGAPTAIAILAAEGLVALWWVLRRWPSLWDLQYRSAE